MRKILICISVFFSIESKAQTPCEAINNVIATGSDFTGIKGKLHKTSEGTTAVYQSNMPFPGSDSVTLHIPAFGFKVWVANLVTTKDEWTASKKYDEVFAMLQGCIFNIGLLQASEANTRLGKTAVWISDILHPEFEKTHKRFHMQLVKMKDLFSDNYMVLLKISYDNDQEAD